MLCPKRVVRRSNCSPNQGMHITSLSLHPVGGEGEGEGEVNTHSRTALCLLLVIVYAHRLALEAKARAYEEMSKGRGLPGEWAGLA